MRRFGSDNLKNMMSRLGMDDSQPIQSKMVTRAVESAQKRVEGNNFDARKRLLEYDDVLRQQREIIYKQRDEVLESDNLRSIIENMIHSVLERVVQSHASTAEDEEQWNLQGIVDYVNANLLPEGDVTVEDLLGKEPDEMVDLIFRKCKNATMKKKKACRKNRCANLKKSFFCALSTLNGLTILMLWNSSGKASICVLTGKLIRFASIKMKVIRCLSL